MSVNSSVAISNYPCPLENDPEPGNYKSSVSFIDWITRCLYGHWPKIVKTEPLLLNSSLFCHNFGPQFPGILGNIDEDLQFKSFTQRVGDLIFRTEKG